MQWHHLFEGQLSRVAVSETFVECSGNRSRNEAKEWRNEARMDVVGRLSFTDSRLIALLDTTSLLHNAQILTSENGTYHPLTRY